MSAGLLVLSRWGTEDAVCPAATCSLISIGCCKGSSAVAYILFLTDWRCIDRVRGLSCTERSHIDNISNPCNIKTSFSLSQKTMSCSIYCQMIFKALIKAWKFTVSAYVCFRPENMTRRLLRCVKNIKRATARDSTITPRPAPTYTSFSERNNMAFQWRYISQVKSSKQPVSYERFVLLDLSQNPSSFLKEKKGPVNDCWEKPKVSWKLTTRLTLYDSEVYFNVRVKTNSVYSTPVNSCIVLRQLRDCHIEYVTFIADIVFPVWLCSLFSATYENVFIFARCRTEVFIVVECVVVRACYHNVFP